MVSPCGSQNLRRAARRTGGSGPLSAPAMANASGPERRNTATPAFPAPEARAKIVRRSPDAPDFVTFSSPAQPRRSSQRR